MSTASVVTPMVLPFIGGRVRAYFAPVNRTGETPAIFDPANPAVGTAETPSAPWVDLGWVTDFTRKSETVIAEVAAGMPATPVVQAMTKVGALVSLSFGAWSKIAMSLTTASQQMNVLAAASTSAAIGSGAKAIGAVGLAANSSATTLYLAGQPASPIKAGDLVVVDNDYAQQTGYVGAAVSGAYVTSAVSVGSDPDYIRRVSFNIARVASVRPDGGYQLAAPLLAGDPGAGMKVQRVLGFTDREGGSFIPEWSAVFAVQGKQGEGLFFYYPRLQIVQGAEEKTTQLSLDISMVQPIARFRALPVTDGNDGAQSLCYRTYYPAVFSAV